MRKCDYMMLCVKGKKGRKLNPYPCVVKMGTPYCELSKRFSLAAKLVHESFMEVCQTGDDSRNLILLRKYCAPKMPGARYL